MAMENREAVYRHAVVERLSSPDELTEMLSINRSQGWLVLGAIGLLLIGALVWGALGTVPVSVRGEGLLQASGGTLDVVTSRAGRVSRIVVESGGVVAAGRPLVELVRGPEGSQGGEEAGKAALRWEISAPYRARVLEVLVNPGQEAVAGTALLTVESADEPLQAVLFVPEELAWQIRPGQPVRLAPKALPNQAQGFLLGKVSRVQAIPATDRGLRRVLSREPLVQAFLARRLRIKVEVELLRLPGDPGRWRWSLGRGSEKPLPSRSELTGEIIVGHENLLSQVLPWLRSAGGPA